MTADWIAIMFFSHLLPTLLLAKFFVYGVRSMSRGRV